MPATAEQIQANVDSLNQAIADGVRQVTIAGQTTTYNTTQSLITARDDALAQLALITQRTGKRYNRQSLLYYAGRGYNDGCGR